MAFGESLFYALILATVCLIVGLGMLPVAADASGGPGMAAPPNDEPHYFLVLLPGNYAVIGQEPDHGGTYAGRAQIRETDGSLEMIRNIGGQSVRATGRVDRASPGEGEVVRFTWPGHEASCLVSTDLDNHGRLSCYWVRQGAAHQTPGLEAFFSTHSWPAGR